MISYFNLFCLFALGEETFFCYYCKKANFFNRVTVFL